MTIYIDMKAVENLHGYYATSSLRQVLDIFSFLGSRKPLQTFSLKYFGNFSCGNVC